VQPRDLVSPSCVPRIA